MVTKIAGNQDQITLKGVAITDEWEQRVRTAATRNGQGFTAFVAETADAAAVHPVTGRDRAPTAPGGWQAIGSGGRQGQ